MQSASEMIRSAVLNTRPFRHVVIDDFLPSHQNAAIREDFSKVLARGEGSQEDRTRFWHRDLLDVRIFWPAPSLEKPFSPFFSHVLFETLGTLFQLPISQDTVLAYHHYAKRSGRLHLHHDYVAGFFQEAPLGNGVNPWYFQCTHSVAPTGGTSRCMVRALTAIYYLNPDWRPGDGGELALFDRRSHAFPAKVIRPLNNRLVVFETSPFSVHSALPNNAPMRNSVAQFFFVRPDDARRRFPSHQCAVQFVGY